jgi:UDP-3-O-[3-hydroxymyristoyl] glucosamine N-acyltransferase
MEITIKQIAEYLGGTIIGDENVSVSSLGKIEEAKKGQLSFLSNSKYLSHIYTTEASAVLVSRSMVLENEVDTNLILVDDAYQALTKLLKLYEDQLPTKSGIENPHFIDKSSHYGKDIYLGAFTSIGANVSIGDNCKIYPNVSIGDDVVIGDNVTLYSGVRIYKDCVLKNNIIIHSNSVIGSDGFGFAPNDKGTFDKIPQLGNVIIEDDVEIGAACTIDRATIGSTIIEKGVKLDNQIQVAHNVEIGEHSVIASQTGIAGSTKIGHHAMIGGQVGIVGHIKLGNYVKIQAQSGIARNLKDKDVVQGSPAFAYGDWNKSYVHFKNLGRLVKQVNNLEKKLLKDE